MHKRPRPLPDAMILNLAQGERVFTSNVFLVQGDRTVLVDPGNEFDVVGNVRDRTDDLDAVVLTHTHSDHVGNTDDVVQAFDVDVWGFDPTHPLVDRPIDDEATVRFGDHEYTALHTPGHISDHLCFHAPGPGILFAGDLVFANGSFGRTDLPGGNRQQLVESIDRVREHVSDDLQEMHTGHGPSITANPAHHIDLAAQAARMG